MRLAEGDRALDSARLRSGDKQETNDYESFKLDQRNGEGGGGVKIGLRLMQTERGENKNMDIWYTAPIAKRLCARLPDHENWNWGPELSGCKSGAQEMWSSGPASSQCSETASVPLNWKKAFGGESTRLTSARAPNSAQTPPCS